VTDQQTARSGARSGRSGGDGNEHAAAVGGIPATSKFREDARGKWNALFQLCEGILVVKIQILDGRVYQRK
jgi:hypothetical protein